MGPRQAMASTPSSSTPGTSRAQGGEHPEVLGRLPARAQRRRQAGRAAHGHVPLGLVVGDLLQVDVARQKGGRALGTPPRKARKAVGGVAHQAEVVRDRLRPDPEPLPHAGRVAHRAGAPVELDHHPVHALGQVLVGRAHQHPGHAGVLRGPRRRGGQGVVGLHLAHRPHGHAERLQRALHERELGEQGGVHARPRLVPGPEVVAEGLDHGVRGDADVRRAGRDQVEHRAHHAPGRRAAGIARDVAREHRMMAEKLVGAID